MKLVHEENIKKIECDKCNKLYVSNANLKRHIARVHEKIKNFKCVNCDYEFISKQELNKHIERKHEKENTCENQAKENLISMLRN